VQIFLLIDNWLSSPNYPHLPLMALLRKSTDSPLHIFVSFEPPITVEKID
jgi:hypothetical protein